MHHHLSEATMLINIDFNHSQCLISGVMHKSVNEYVPVKLSNKKYTTPAGYTDGEKIK